MPLITITGHPSTGKTSFAKKLKEVFEKRITDDNLNYTVTHIEDSTLGFNKESYSTQFEEKKLRGALLASVERGLSKENILILDSCNYIKGFRYQLYCIARAIATPHCVVQMGVNADQAKEWNDNREGGYTEQTMIELLNRYEEPISFNRWDSPLFIHLPEDEIEPIAEQIFTTLTTAKALLPNMSTQNKPLSSVNHLYELDRITSKLINEILEFQRENPNQLIKLSSVEIPLDTKGKIISIVMLKKWKKTFVDLNKSGVSKVPLDRIPILFIQFLNDAVVN